MLVIAGLLVVFTGCGETEHKGEAARPSGSVRVAVEEIQAAPETSAVEMVGTVKSTVTTTVSSQTFGRVLATRYEEGARVEKGVVMVTIDPEQARAGVEQAEAGLREAQMALREVESGYRAAGAGLDMAKANASLAEATFRRFQALLERESVSRQEYDEVEARSLAARAAVNQAEQSVQAMEEKKAQVQARITQAEAGLKQARLNFGYTEVTAPYNGIVVSKMVQAGQLAAPGVPLYAIEKNDFELHVSVDLTRSRDLRAGLELPVSFDHLSESVTGKVKEVVPVADPVSRTVLVKITLPDVPGIYSGVFGRAAFRVEGSSAITVPASALVRRGQLTGVYVVEDRVARYRLVRTGRLSGLRVEVLSGLNPGESIVTDPAQVSEGVGIESL